MHKLDILLTEDLLIVAPAQFDEYTTWESFVESAVCLSDDMFGSPE